MSIQQTIFTVLAIIIFLVIADLTGFTSGKNKLKKLLPFKKAKQIDSEKIQKKITEYELSDPFYNTNDEIVHIYRLNFYGKSKYLGEMLYKKSYQGDFFKEQEEIIRKFNKKAKKRSLDKQIYKNLKIIKKLKKLGIDSSDQLKKKELDFWWQKKYKEIKESQLKAETVKEELIEINEIYQELSKEDKKLLVEIIIKQSNEED